MRELAVSDMSGATCFENVLAAFNASQEDRLPAGVKRPVLPACMFACQAVVADNTQGCLVVNAGQFGLDTDGKLSGCFHASFVRIAQRVRKRFVRLFCVRGEGRLGRVWMRGVCVG